MEELVKILNEQKERIDKFDLELEKKDKQIDKLIEKAGINNSTITQNIQNNIKLLAYDKTDISDLTDKDFMKCFNHNNMCVPHLIKRIHFNPKKPENHNVFISNLKSGHIMIYDGKQWNTFNRDEIVDDIFDNKNDILEQKIEEWVSIGKDYPIIYHKFKRYLEKINNDIVLKKVKDEMKFVLYNNRNIVKKNYLKIENYKIYINMNNSNETMDILESKFINMSLTKKMYLYFNHYKNEDISNYEKKSITITNSDFKNLKMINNEDKFKDFFKNIISV